MPSQSKAQFRFMEGVKHGSIKRPGLSPEKAAEFVDNVDYKSLPARAKSQKKRVHISRPPGKK